MGLVGCERNIMVVRTLYMFALGVLAFLSAANSLIGRGMQHRSRSSRRTVTSFPLRSSVDGEPERVEMDYRSEYPPYSAEWAAERGMEPGFGGVWPGNPEAKKYKVTVRSRKTNETFVAEVANDRYVYYAFEEERKQLPIVNSHKMCRQGCCTICAAKIVEGKMKMDAPLGLLKELRSANYGLLCCSMPRSDVVVELQDEDEMYVRQWSEGFEGGGIEWGGVFMDED